MLVLILPPFAVLPFMRMEQMTLSPPVMYVLKRNMQYRKKSRFTRKTTASVKAQKASPSPQYGDRLKKSPDHAVNSNRKSEVESKSCNIFAPFLDIVHNIAYF